MKHLLFTFFMLFAAMLAHAAKLSSGSLECLKGEKFLAVSLDCSKTTYKKTRSFEDFLKKAPRIENWEHESLKYFIERFNEKTYKQDFVTVLGTSKNKGKYELVIVPTDINGGGGITAIANLVNVENGNIEATINFSTDGDDDDKITLRDPMKEAGEQIGKLISKVIKK